MTITETSIPSDSRIDKVYFEFDVAKLLDKCQCVQLLFSALQSDGRYLCLPLNNSSLFYHMLQAHASDQWVKLFKI